jgi:Flp pilus assembly pilin Flp
MTCILCAEALCLWQRDTSIVNPCKRFEGTNCMRRFLQELRKRSGESLVEYTLILMLIAMVAVAVLRSIGPPTANSMMPVNNALQ